MNYIVQSEHFKIYFGFILMIKIIYIVQFVVRINTVKSYGNQIQNYINEYVHLVLFYNLINECDTYDYIHLL